MSDDTLLIRDFRAFMFYVWHAVGLPEPTDVQIDIAKWMMAEHRRKGIMAFRGVGKSWISCAFCVWLLLRNVEEKILVVSAGESKAMENAFFIRRLIDELPICSHLRGGERDSIKSFDIAGCQPSPTPSVRTVGVTGQMTGGRASYILADDVEIPNNSDTQHKREQLAERIKEFDAILLPGGSVMFLGTPQTEESIYNVLRTDRGYTFRIWPARYPLLAKLDAYRGDLAPMVYGAYANGLGTEWRPTDIRRFTDDDLNERELSYGKSGFALQFMLDTSLSDADRFPLKLRELVVSDFSSDGAPIRLAWTGDKAKMLQDLGNPGLTGDSFQGPAFVAPEFRPFEGIAMAVDPSGRGKDETAYAIVGQLLGRLFVLKVGGLASGAEGFSDSVLDELLKQAKLWGVRELIVEENAGHGMFTKLLKARMHDLGHVRITEVRQSKQKEKRLVDNLEPLFNQHRIIVNRSVIEEDSKVKERDYRLFYQVTRLTSDRGALAHDDRLDALEMTLSFFIEAMGRNVEKAAVDHEWKSIVDQEREFAKSICRLQIRDPRVSTEIPKYGMKMRRTLSGLR